MNKNQVLEYKKRIVEVLERIFLRFKEMPDAVSATTVDKAEVDWLKAKIELEEAE